MWRAVAAACLAGVAAGCAHGGKPTSAATPAAAGDATARLVATADAHLAAGIASLEAGHLQKAREEFDKAVDVYLGAPGGAYASPGLAEAYRRTVETIHVQEVEALAAGDGFTEQGGEPAAIDEVADLALGAPPASEEVRRLAEEALRGETHDVPIELNDPVLSCIALYQDRLRDWFTEALARGGRYLPHIRDVFASEGIPQDLAYVALVESAFKTSALSRAKAKGVWQFIPATGRRFGLRQDWWVDERSDPDKATRAAAQYLKTLYGIFGDWNLALAGYNAGEGRVLRSLDRHGVEDFWGLFRRGALARETRNYVPMIHAAIIVAKAPEKYGFQVTPEPPLTFDTVPLHAAVDLRVVAECLSSTVDDLRQLNPALRRLATPATGFGLKVPPGTAETVRTCLDELPPSRRVTFRTHVVARGQTLGSLARRYGASTRDIMAANGLRSTRLRRGMELIIPVAPSRARAEAPRAVAAAPPAPAGAVAESRRISYRVQAGDTLSRIAARFGTTVQKIAHWNRLRGSRIAAGRVLTIYAAATAPAAGPAAMAAGGAPD